MKRLFWLVGIVTLCVFLSCALWYIQKDTKQHIILRLPTGFFPNSVHIEKDESLKFINLTLRTTWPAAGPHPSHITYPDFDMIGGIAPLHTWVFTFAKSGTYTFHDHYAPEINGVVVSGSNDVSQVTEQSTCKALSDPLEQASCMEIYFRGAASKMTFIEARALFNDLAVRYQGSCHTFAHDLGKNAYTAYLKKQLPDVTQEASSCGNGFWHGFTTAMQAYGGIEESKEFCASLKGATDIQQSNSRTSCYHGIGIGLIPDPPPAYLWGAFQPLIEPALVFCDTIQGDPSYRERCLTGIFHAVSDYMIQKLYGFNFDENSLTKCAELVSAYQKTCFITLVSALPANTDFDLARTVAIIKKNTPQELFSDIFFHAAIIFVHAEAPIEEAGRFVDNCEVQNKDFRSICIEAVINKFYNNGLPGNEYQKASAFCSSVWVYTSEKERCFQEVISYAIAVYTAEKVVEACDYVPEVYRSSIQKCNEPTSE